MKSNGVFGAVSFRFMLLEQYKKLGFNEKELAVLLMIDHLLDQGNEVINNDSLALKMTLSPQEIDSILASLLDRKVISYEFKDNKLTTSLDPLYEKLGKALAKSMEYQREKNKAEEKEAKLISLNSFFEERWERSLSPIEKSTLEEWIEAGYKESEIMNALRDGLREGKVNVRYIDKRLKALRAINDFEEEGYSATSSTWDKPIGESLSLAKKKWEDE